MFLLFFRHSVLVPITLLLGQCLTQCPVRSHKDISSGLLVSSILISFNMETKRIVPECLEFLRSVSCAFLPQKILKKG